MAIPYEIFITYVAITTTIFLVGVIMGIKKISGAPFFCVIAGMMLFVILAIPNSSFQVPSSLYNETIAYSVSHPMNVTVSTTSTAFSTTVKAIGERPANVNSALVNAHISCIEINMLRTLNPTGAVNVGILDNDGRVIKSFGNITASTINTGTRSYQVCLGNHDYWVLAYNDYVGARHDGSTGTDFIAVSDTNTNPFDGTNSVKTVYTTSWTDTSANDIRMKLTSEDLKVVKTPIPYKLSDNDEWAFLIILSILFIIVGVILQVQKW